MTHRFAIEPLAAVCKIELGQLGHPDGDETIRGLAALAERVGVTYDCMTSNRRRGINERTADRYACAVGVLPSDVWPEWYDVTVDDLCRFWCRCDSPSPLYRRCDSCGGFLHPRSSRNAVKGLAA